MRALSKISVFYRLLASFCLIILILTIGFGTSLFSSLKPKIENEIYRSNLEILGQTSQIVDVVLEDIEQNGRGLLVNQAINQLVHSEWSLLSNQPQLLQSVQVLQDRITSSTLMNSIYLYKENEPYLITSNGFQRIDYFHDREFVEQSFSTAEREKWYAPREISGTFHKERLISYILKTKSYDGKTIQMVINLNEKLLFEATLALNRNKLHRILVRDSEGEVILNSSRIRLTPEIESASATGYNVYSLDGEAYLVSYYRSDHNGWQYTSMMPLSRIRQPIRDMLNDTLTLSVICLIVGFLLAFVVAYRHLLPLKRLVKHLSGLTGTGKAILGDEFRSIRGEFGRHFLLSLLRSNPMQPEEIDHYMKYYGIELERCGFVVMTLHVDFCHGPGLSLEERTLLKVNIKASAEKQIEGTCKYLIMPYDEHHLVIILSGKPAAYAIAERILNKALAFPDASISIGIGEWYPDSTLISKSFEESREALHFRKLSGPGSIFSISDLMVGDGLRKTLGMMDDKGMELLNAVKIGDDKQACALLEGIVSAIRRDPDINIHYKNMILMHIVNILIKSVIDLNGNVKEIFSDECNPHYEITRITSFEDMEQWLNVYLVKTTDYLKGKRKHRNHDLIDKVEHYVKLKYYEPITTQSIADELFINNSYFCKMFKQLKGQTFGEYLTAVRLEAAVLLLVDKHKTIDEIAELCGFGGKQNFIRACKKHFGATPTDYRKRIATRSLATES